jgi:hypothetical protein
MYYIVQRYGRESLCTSAEGRTALVSAANCALVALRGADLLREAASSCAILLWAAWSLPGVSPAFAARQLGTGLCCRGERGAEAANASQDASPTGSASFVEETWQQQARLC